MDDQPLRIVQISDIHLFGDKNKSLLGVNTQASLEAALALLRANEKNFDLIIISGDLSQDASKESYLRLADMFKEFPVPVYYVAGNHDDSDVMKKIYPLGNITHHRHIVLKQWHIILLDSHIQKSVEGRLAPDQLHFMEHCLQMYPEHHAIVVFHHQPIPVGSKWLDNIGLKNADVLWPILANFPHMHTILFGHVHQQQEGVKNGIRYYSTPSTCIQFKRNSAEFALEELPPGYRWIELYPDGTLKTDVVRAAQYIGIFDKDARGY